MKKVSTYALILGGVLIITGLIWSGFSWRRVEHDVQHISRQGYASHQTVLPSDSVQHLNVDVGDVTVAIKPQPDAMHVKVDYFETKTDKFQVARSGDAITIARAHTEDDWKNGFCLWRCIGTPHTITVYVPADSIYRYDIATTDGGVEFSGALHTKTMRLVSGDGTVKLSDVSTDGTMNVQNDNGGIALQNVSVSGALALKSSDASTTLTKVQAPDITSTSNNGSTSLTAVTTKDLTVHSDNASIMLDRLMADHSTLTNDNGSITGSMVGTPEDYDMRIGSSNGSIRLNGKKYDGAYFSGSDKAAKSLSVKASNASVNITFVK